MASSATCGSWKASAKLFKCLRIDDVDRLAGGEGVDLVEDVGELELVLVARDVAEMRRADHVVHRQQRMLAAEHRLFVVDVDRRLSRPARLYRRLERPRPDERRTAGVY